jgi:hypothetical protein
MNNASVVPAPSIAGKGSAQIGQSRVLNYQANAIERLADVQNVADRDLDKWGASGLTAPERTRMCPN